MNTRLFSAIVLTGAALTGGSVVVNIVAAGAVVSTAGCDHPVAGSVAVGLSPLDIGLPRYDPDMSHGDMSTQPVDMGTARPLDIAQGAEGGVSPHD
jgi:hypothetical protein